MDPVDFSLTHGQVAWALARGQRPSDQLIDQLRYLRQLEVPLSKAELGAGSGNRIRYGLDQLMESTSGRLSGRWAAKASSISRRIVSRVASSGFFSSISRPEGAQDARLRRPSPERQHVTALHRFPGEGTSPAIAPAAIYVFESSPLGTAPIIVDIGPGNPAACRDD